MALEKAVITNTVTGVHVAVLFNPEEYTVNRDNSYAQAVIPGLSAPLLQFVNGGMRTLEMDLLVDTYEEHRIGSRVINNAHDDVRNLTGQITDLMNIEPSTHAPPTLLFTWAPQDGKSMPGGVTRSNLFTCVLARIVQRFVMFLPDGTPVRARLRVTFHECRDVDLEAKEIKRETSDFTKRHVVTQAETLSGIAATEYGDPSVWRVIALANGMDTPRDLSPGQTLILPSLPYRDPDTGAVVT